MKFVIIPQWNKGRMKMWSCQEKHLYLLYCFSPLTFKSSSVYILSWNWYPACYKSSHPIKSMSQTEHSHPRVLSEPQWMPRQIMVSLHVNYLNICIYMCMYVWSYIYVYMWCVYIYIHMYVYSTLFSEKQVMSQSHFC